MNYIWMGIPSSQRVGLGELSVEPIPAGDYDKRFALFEEFFSGQVNPGRGRSSIVHRHIRPYSLVHTCGYPFVVVVGAQCFVVDLVYFNYRSTAAFIVDHRGKSSVSRVNQCSFLDPTEIVAACAQCTVDGQFHQMFRHGYMR